MPRGSLAGLHSLGGPTSDDHRRNLIALAWAILLFAGLVIYCAVKSDGFLEGDAFTHYTLSRFAFKHPENFLDVWGRPLCTGIYAIPAVLGGRLAVKMTSLAMALVCGIAVYRIAKNQGFRWPALATILLFAQPLFFMHAWSELTELPFAMVMILAFWAYQGRRFALMAILVALTPLGRPEGFGLMLLAALVLVIHRRWLYLAILPMGLLAWTYLGWLEQSVRLGGTAIPWYRWLSWNWPYATQSMYGRGPIYHFVGMLPILVSPLLFPALLVGIGGMVKEGTKAQRHGGTKGKENPDEARHNRPLGFLHVLRGSYFLPESPHRAQVNLGIVGVPLMVLLVHSVLWWRGWMASNGELRYLLSVAPLWALVTARGFEGVWNRLDLRAPFLGAAILASIPVIANLVHPVVPLRLSERDRPVQTAALWYADSPELRKDYPLVMAAHPAVYYWLDISPKDPAEARQFHRTHIDCPPRGVALLWNAEYGLRNSDPKRVASEEDLAAAGWIRIQHFDTGPRLTSIWVSPQTIAGKATSWRTPPVD